MKVEIIEPVGYCNGVKRAIGIALNIKKENPNKIIKVLGQLVHNSYCDDFLKSNNIEIINISFKNYIEYIKNDDNKNVIYILSAHGTNKDLFEYLNKNNINYIDATCPIVSSISKRLSKINNLIYLYKNNHPESYATISYLKKDAILIDIKKDNDPLILSKNKKYIIANQSTIDLMPFYLYLSKNYENEFEIINNFCPSINDRIKNIYKSFNRFNFYIVVGDKTSSNANELLNQILIHNKEGILINSLNELLSLNIINKINKKEIAITSATSSSIDQVNEIYNYLNNYR